MPAKTRHPHNRNDTRRDEILDTALEVFAPNGYLGTTTDMLAKEAAISKQTLYKYFGDKDGVFAALVHRACERVVDPFAPLVDEMQTIASAEQAVRKLADQFVGAIMNPDIQKLRRLVIAEAPRFPDLAEEYWQSGFGRMLVSLADCFAVLHQRQLLHVSDTELAAQHFAGMMLWIPGNRAMFNVSEPMLDRDDIATIISTGSAAFLRAYAH